MNQGIQREEMIQKMLAPALKEKFLGLGRRYGQDRIVKTWAEMEKSGEMKNFFEQIGWNEKMTLAEVLDALDRFILSIERRIRGLGQ